MQTLHFTPRSKGNIEPLYNEVQRLKEQQGLTDAEALTKFFVMLEKFLNEFAC